MAAPHPRPDETERAPEGFRDALTELVQIGLSVARLVWRVAEAETALAEAASRIGAAEGVSALAESLAQAIEADQAAAAAAEARQTVVARAQLVSVAFARVARSLRLRTWREINESEWCEERNDRIAIIACSDARA